MWKEEEYWDEEKLYSEYQQLCQEMYVDMGFNQGFPFIFKIPMSERETFHGADRKVAWLISAEMRIEGRKHVKTEKYEILVTKPIVSATSTKEVVREVFLVPRAYCSGLMPQTAIFCPNCGARRK